MFIDASYCLCRLRGQTCPILLKQTRMWLELSRVGVVDWPQICGFRFSVHSSTNSSSLDTETLARGAREGWNGCLFGWQSS